MSKNNSDIVDHMMNKMSEYFGNDSDYKFDDDNKNIAKNFMSKFLESNDIVSDNKDEIISGIDTLFKDKNYINDLKNKALESISLKDFGEKTGYKYPDNFIKKFDSFKKESVLDWDVASNESDHSDIIFENNAENNPNSIFYGMNIPEAPIFGPDSDEVNSDEENSEDTNTEGSYSPYKLEKETFQCEYCFKKYEKNMQVEWNGNSTCMHCYFWTHYNPTVRLEADGTHGPTVVSYIKKCSNGHNQTECLNSPRAGCCFLCDYLNGKSFTWAKNYSELEVDNSSTNIWYLEDGNDIEYELELDI